MSVVTDQHHVAAGAAVARDFRTLVTADRWREYLQPTPAQPRCPYRDAVSAEEDRSGVSGTSWVLREEITAVLQVVDHEAVVHDFVAP